MEDEELLEAAVYYLPWRRRVLFWFGRWLAHVGYRLMRKSGIHVWKSFNGEVHVIEQMRDEHLLNAERMLYRRGEIHTPEYRAMMDTILDRELFPKRRGKRG